MAKVRCGNRGCKKYIEKSDAFRAGISHYCDRACIFGQANAPKPKGKRSSPTSARPIPKNVRVKVSTRDNFCCRLCGSSSYQLHHINYRSEVKNKPWENEPWNLIALCSRDHDAVHGDKFIWKQILLGMNWVLEVDGARLSLSEFIRRFSFMVHGDLDRTIREFEELTGGEYG